MIERVGASAQVRRTTAALLRRPVLTTSIAGVVVATVHVAWVLTHRDLGAYNVDEAGYIATALRYQRAIDLTAPQHFIATVFSPSPTGPLVPVLALPLLIIGPRSVGTVMVVQSILGVAAAVAAAGLARRVAGDGAGMIAGVVVLCLPAVVNSARTFQYAMAVGACALLALWALVSSERGGRRWPMVAFGAAAGAMLLARTMALGFLPALAVSAIIVVRPRRRELTNLGLAAATALLVAGPWWYTSRDELYDYLFRFGYGDQAGLYGSQDLMTRLVDRIGTGVGDVRLPFLLIALVALVWLVVNAVSTGLRDGMRAWPLLNRDLAAIAGFVVGAYLALMSTANQGVWFELPVEVVAVTGLIAAVTLVGGPPARYLGIAAVLVGASTILVSWLDRGGPYDEGTPVGFVQALAVGGLDEKERVLADADEGFLSNDRSTRATAARKWWQLNEGLVSLLGASRPTSRTNSVLFSGSSHLLNGQTLLLAYELAGQDPPPLYVPDTRDSDDELRDLLSVDDAGDRPRVLIAAPSSLPFPEDREHDRLARVAAGLDYTVVASRKMPDGGTVELWVPPR